VSVPAVSVSVPWAGWVATVPVSGSPSASVSLASTMAQAKVSLPSSSSVPTSSTATGASLTAVTVIVTDAGAEAVVPSSAV
jgi:hypothetical protein